MRRFPIGIVCLVASTLCCGCSGTEEEKASPGKYVVTLHDQTGEKEQSYDMSKAADRIKLAHDLEAGHVHELKKDEPPDLFAPKRWDLGIWSLVIFAALFFVLAKFAWKPMLAGLQQREENIRSALDQRRLPRHCRGRRGEDRGPIARCALRPGWSRPTAMPSH